MELVSTMEISGEEREIADAYARGQINASNVATISGMSYSADSDEINIYAKMEPNATVADRVNWHDDALNGVFGTMNAVKQNINSNIDGINSNLTQQSTEAMDLKMLGWSVPKECPIQNYVDSDGVFHQRVGRVDLGSLDWKYGSSLARFQANVPNKIIPSSNNEWDRGLYCSIYKSNTSPISGTKVDMTISGYINTSGIFVNNFSYTDATAFKNAMQGVYLYYELAEEKTISVDGNEAVTQIKNDLAKQCKKDDITTNETLIGTFNGKNYYRRLFTGIGASGSSVTVNVGEKIEIYNYYGRAYVYGQSGASAAKYPIPNKNYYIDSQNISETSFQLTIPTSSDTRKVDLVIEYTKVDE